MDDAQIHGTIEQLVAEEHELWEREAAGAATDEDRRRLDAVKVSLDQCWDLLRQRRALREFGGDPDQAEVRPPRRRAGPSRGGRPGPAASRRRYEGSCARRPVARRS